MVSFSKHYDKEVVPEMMARFEYKSRMAVPRLKKIVVNIGVGKREEKEREEIRKHLESILGQKLVGAKAKQAIAGFKTREGMIIGYKATLRGRRMYDFLDRLIRIAMPRTRDFRGLDIKSVDSGGHLTIGIREHIVFPEMIGADVKTIFGFEVTLVSSARNREEAIEFYKLMGIPFKK